MGTGDGDGHGAGKRFWSAILGLSLTEGCGDGHVTGDGAGEAGLSRGDGPLGTTLGDCTDGWDTGMGGGMWD